MSAERPIAEVRRAGVAMTRQHRRLAPPKLPEEPRPKAGHTGEVYGALDGAVASRRFPNLVKGLPLLVILAAPSAVPAARWAALAITSPRLLMRHGPVWCLLGRCTVGDRLWPNWKRLLKYKRFC